MRFDHRAERCLVHRGSLEGIPGKGAGLDQQGIIAATLARGSFAVAYLGP